MCRQQYRQSFRHTLADAIFLTPLTLLAVPTFEFFRDVIHWRAHCHGWVTDKSGKYGQCRCRPRCPHGSIVEHVAGVDDFEVAEATYRAAVVRWPRARITLRQGARSDRGQPPPARCVGIQKMQNQNLPRSKAPIRKEERLTIDGQHRAAVG
jgi:hypothetical protein